MSICIIPARQGSKRIKNKNIVDFYGKPIIYYPIKEAKKAKIFSNIYVSTDSAKIRKISESFGAIGLNFRKKKYSDDHTNIKDVLKNYILTNGLKNEKYICCIYPTSVLITAGLIKKAFLKFKKENCEMLITLCQFSNSPDRSFIIKNKKFAFFANKKNESSRSQDLLKKYYDTGTLYFFKTKKLLESKDIFPSKMSFLVLNELNSQDINTKEDLILAKMKYKFK
tara:strand:- start:1900 stop:2574 length:675 start_codon:yes stop_codon:yes gene_type:complete